MRMFHHLRLWFFTFSDYLCRVDLLDTNYPVESKSGPLGVILEYSL